MSECRLREGGARAYKERTERHPVDQGEGPRARETLVKEETSAREEEGGDQGGGGGRDFVDSS